MTPQQALGAAADYLERFGWTQGRFKDGAGRCCLQGVLLEVCPDPYVRQAAMSVLRSVTGAASLFSWNDAPSRTEGEVVTALRLGALRP